MNLQHRCLHFSTLRYVPHGWPIIYLFISTQYNVLRSTKHEALRYAVFDNLLSRPPSFLVKFCPKPHNNNTQLVRRLKLDTMKSATVTVIQLQRGYLIGETFVNWANVDGKCIARNLTRATWNIKTAEQKYWECLVRRRKICANSPYLYPLYNVSFTKLCVGICIE
jgi:hypothetical protein